MAVFLHRTSFTRPIVQRRRISSASSSLPNHLGKEIWKYGPSLRTRSLGREIRASLLWQSHYSGSRVHATLTNACHKIPFWSREISRRVPVVSSPVTPALNSPKPRSATVSTTAGHRRTRPIEHLSLLCARPRIVLDLLWFSSGAQGRMWYQRLYPYNAPAPDSRVPTIAYPSRTNGCVGRHPNVLAQEDLSLIQGHQVTCTKDIIGRTLANPRMPLIFQTLLAN